MRYFETPNVCGPCGGKCCKGMPGCAYPDDFPTAEDVEAALATGRWAVDWWEGDAREDHDELSATYFIRPAVKGYEGRRMHPSWGGECTFLREDGCELPAEKRPKECRQLEPDKEGNCKMHGGCGMQDAAIAWIQRADELCA